MITEEIDDGNVQYDPKDTFDSMQGMGEIKEENLTFPRRSRCPRTVTRKVDWMEMLAKATEEDKKANIDLTFPPDENESLSDDVENEAPVPMNLSETIPKRIGEEVVLDLSDMNRSTEPRSVKKGYTMPTYEPQYVTPNNYKRSLPLKEIPVISYDAQKLSQPSTGHVHLSAKKSLLFNSNNYFEKQIVNHKHILLHMSDKKLETHQEEVEIQPIEGIQGTLQQGSRFGLKEEIREYGHSNSSGFYGQTNTNPLAQAPLHPVQFQQFPSSNDHHQPHVMQSNDHHQPHVMQSNDRHQPHVLQSATPSCNVFAVPEPPQRFKNSNKDIPVNGKFYQILARIGKGGSSVVYLVLAKDSSLLAIKSVNLGNVDEKMKMDHLNEIEHLLKMQHCKHIIKIFDHQYIPSQNRLYVVMERGDTDLSRLLKERMTSGEGVPPEMILFYWSEILLAVKSIHDNNIIHRDLKPANFLLVAGRLKLIDFGIASAIQSEQTSVFKESQSGTPNYMSPEAWEDLGVGDQRMVRIGRKTDVWSLGCILYTFIYGKTPFQEYGNFISKFRAITNPNHNIPFPKVKGVPDLLIQSCRRCLIFDKNKRASIDELLELKSQILMTPSEVIGKLRRVLDDEAVEKARVALLPCENG